MSGYTKVDNWLFDVVMPKANGSTFKVVSAVVRQTTGWNRDEDTISITQFQDMLGTSSRTTVSEAIQDAIDNGWIAREKHGQGYKYWVVVTSPESVPSSPDSGLPTSPDSGPQSSPESGHTKEHSKDKVKELASHFEAKTGLMSNPGVWDEQWAEPLWRMYQRAGDMGRAKMIIDKSVEFARDGPKQYTITSPASIVKIAANISLNGDGEKKVKVRSR